MLTLEGSCMIITFLSIRIFFLKALLEAKLSSNTNFEEVLLKCH